MKSKYIIWNEKDYIYFKIKNEMRKYKLLFKKKYLFRTNSNKF